MTDEQKDLDLKTHLHPAELTENLSRGQRAAEWIVEHVGSWRFIIVQSVILSLWFAANVVGFCYHWDPYPFILANLALSLQAAYTGPLVLMAAKRQDERNRMLAENTYHGVEEVRRSIKHCDKSNEKKN